MNYVRLPVLLSLLALAGSPAWSQVVEAESNSCSSAHLPFDSRMEQTLPAARAWAAS